MVRPVISFALVVLIADFASAQQTSEAAQSQPDNPTIEQGFDGEVLQEEGAVAGQELYAIGIDSSPSGSSYLYRIDNYAASPRAQIIGDTHRRFLDLAIDPQTNRFYAIDRDGGLYEIDPTNGFSFFIGFTGRSDLNSLEFDATGEAWAWGNIDGNLYHVDKEAGTATRIGFVGHRSGGDLAFDVNGTLYGTTENELIRINRNNGTGARVGSLGFGGAFGLDIDSTGTMYVGRGSDSSGLSQLYRVNKGTGAATFVGTVSGAGAYGLAGLAFSGAPASSALFLRNGRFRVETTWRLPNGSTGPGQPVQLTSDTGYFWFFDAANVEMVIKVLSACGLNGRYWVFAGGLTSVRVETRVTDTLTGALKTYVNPQGTAFQPVQDTAAFTTCP